jgi:hypothetical protein
MCRGAFDAPHLISETVICDHECCQHYVVALKIQNNERDLFATLHFE